jgi:hypothetical protein
MSAPSTSQNSFDVFSNLLSQPDRYWPLLMTVTKTEKDDLEAELDRLANSLLDAKDPGFQAVFPPDIMAQNNHLIFFWISQTAVTDESLSYKDRFLGPGRRVLVGLPGTALKALDGVLARYLSPEEGAAYLLHKRRPNAPVRFDPKPHSFGLWIVQGIRPE